MLRFSKKDDPMCTFVFAAPPRVHTAWVAEAFAAAGFVSSVIDSYDRDDLVVSLVCHPYQWLLNVFSQLPTKRCYTDSTLNKIIHFAAISKTFEEFASRAVEVPGQISQIFNKIQADTVMRIEDLPWNLIEFLTSYEVPPEDIGKIKGIILPSLEQNPDDTVRRMIVRAEWEFCERYNYV